MVDGAAGGARDSKEDEGEGRMRAMMMKKSAIKKDCRDEDEIEGDGGGEECGEEDRVI